MGDAVPHGTLGGYNNHRCRCVECRRVSADYHRRRRRARAVLLEFAPEVPHGRASTYDNWGCRCQACLAAKYGRRQP